MALSAIEFVYISRSYTMAGKYVGLRTLLDLSEQVLDQEDGYWVKIEAWEVKRSDAIPHGIRYSLTLHAPSGRRILGYDNAHLVSVRRGRFGGRRLPFDHRHRHAADTGVPYEFEDAHQLLSDFFAEADAVLKEVKSK
jgi:Family of unknown function (DUF6516)